MKKVFLSWVFIIPLFAFGQEIDKDLSFKLDSLIRVVNENILIIDTAEVASFCKKINDRVISMEGENSINMSLVCRCFGYASGLRKDFKAGEKWFLKAVNISKKFGEESELYWTLMTDLANIKSAIGETDKALEIYYRKAGYYEKKSGDNSFEILKVKLGISQILKRASRIQEAEKVLFDIEEKITEKNEEQQRLKIEWLNAIADIFNTKGNYTESSLYYSRAVDIFEKNRFSVSKLYFEIGYAEALKSKGGSFTRIGKHKEAEELTSQAIDIMIRLLPNNHERVLRAKYQMGIANYAIQNLNKSENIFLDLLPQIEENLGQEGDLYSHCLHMLGSTTYELGKYDDAEKYYMKSYEIQKKLYGEENLQLWMTIYTISYVYMQKKEFDTAEKWFFKAKKLVEDQLGKESGAYAQCLAGLGQFYIETKNYEKAYQVNSEALILKEKTHGKRSLRYLTSQFMAGWSGFLTGEIEKSSKHFLIGDSLHQLHMKNSIYFMTETEKANFLKKKKPAKDGLFSILFHEAHSGQNNEVILKAAYNYNLFYNGFLADAVIRLNKLVADHPGLKSDYDSLKMHKRALIKEQSKVPGTSNSEMISNTEDKIFEIEKRLTLSVSKFGELIRDFDIEAVQKRLRSNECAIEFVDFTYLQEDSLNNISTYCIALVLHPDKDIPKFIPLFEQRSLDSLLQLHEERRSGYVNDLYSYSERGAVSIGKPEKSLYELIWQPLEKELEGKETIFYSPAGLLHRINLNAIPFDDETTIGEKIKLVRVNSTRQLAIPQTLEKSTNDAVLFGGIQYEIDSAAIVVANKEVLYNSVASRNLGEMKFETSEITSRGDVWNYLKWTKKEVETIADILDSSDYKTTTRTDFLATEEAFRAIGQRSLSPRILHVATHGFFFPDPNTSNNKEDGDQSAFKTNRHPMIRSGLIMAGGNHAWQNKPALKGMEDGILTAYEISQMNLTNTELVVLSACETGLGDIQGNEGVYGLQRAFKIAGAKYLIMSLWQVPDRETKDFMVAFYQHWLEDEMTIPDAFRKTQEDMKKRFYNPYQWAGFILVE